MPDAELVSLLALVVSFLVVVVMAFNNYRKTMMRERFWEDYKRRKDNS